MKSVHIVDYGHARTQRLAMAFSALCVDTVIVRKAHEIADADLLVVPDGIDDSNFLLRGIAPDVLAAIAKHIQDQKPLLAIGLGLVLLSTGYRSEEIDFGGVGFLDVPVVRFKREMVDAEGAPLRSPHIGYSFVVGLDRHPTMAPALGGEKRGVWLYFRHRLCIDSRVPFAEVAVAHHGVPFAGALWRDRVLACQFLPELSGKLGLNLLSSWYQANRSIRGNV